MAFTPQNFVDKVGPAIKAAWLNALDVLANSVLQSATTVPQALAALGISVQSSTVYGVDSGAANAYVVTRSPTNATLAVGSLVQFVPLSPNTGPSTVNVDGSGIKNIVNQYGNALTGGEISVPTWLQWTGAVWQIVGTGPTPDKARTPAEISLGTIPTSYIYPASAFYDARRYGALADYGVTDNTAAVQTAINVCGQPLQQWSGTASFAPGAAGTSNMTVNSTVSGSVQLGQLVTGAGVAAGTYVYGGSAPNWVVVNTAGSQQTIASEAMTTSQQGGIVFVPRNCKWNYLTTTFINEVIVADLSGWDQDNGQWNNSTKIYQNTLNPGTKNSNIHYIRSAYGPTILMDNMGDQFTGDLQARVAFFQNGTFRWIIGKSITNDDNLAFYGRLNTQAWSGNGTIAGTAFTVNSTVSGAVAIGQYVFGAGVAFGTKVTGGSAPNWVVNHSQNAGPESMTTSNLTLTTRLGIGDGAYGYPGCWGFNINPVAGLDYFYQAADGPGQTLNRRVRSSTNGAQNYNIVDQFYNGANTHLADVTVNGGNGNYDITSQVVNGIFTYGGTNEVGWMGYPRSRTITTSSTVAYADRGGSIFVNANSITLTVATTSPSLPNGATIKVYANGTGITILAGGLNLYLGGAQVSGTRTLAAGALCTLTQIAVGTWIAEGAGVT